MACPRCKSDRISFLAKSSFVLYDFSYCKACEWIGAGDHREAAQ